MIVRRLRFVALATCIAAAALGAPVAVAADFPTDTVRVISAFPPGGGVDAIARYITKSVSEKLGQAFVVEDRPGAGGGVAAAYVKTAPADGYTLLHTITSTVAVETAFQELEYSKDDFDYVAGVVQFEAAIVARAEAPWKDLNDLIETAKKEGRQVTFGGQTRLDRMVVDQINAVTDEAIALVPFQGGPDIIAAVLGGHVDTGWSGTLHVPLIAAGKMKALAVVGDERYESYPDVPTLEELGYPNSFNLIDIFAVPKGTPKETIDVLAKAILEAAQEPGFLELCSRYNFFPQTLGPAETAALVDKQFGRAKHALAAINN